MRVFAFRTGARPVVAPLLLSLVVTATATAACSGSSTPRAAAPQPSATPSTAATTDPGASAAVARAEKVVGETRSFTFAATEVLSGDVSHATSVRGSVVRGQGVSYTLDANGRTSQVVRIAGATYVRAVPGRWAKLVKPRPVTDPATTLIAVLRGLTQMSLRSSGGAQVVTGSLAPAAAKAAQLPASAPARVEVTLDPAGHVAKLVVTTVSGGTGVTLTTTYAGFGAVPPLKPPV